MTRFRGLTRCRVEGSRSRPERSRQKGSSGTGSADGIGVLRFAQDDGKNKQGQTNKTTRTNTNKDKQFPLDEISAERGQGGLAPLDTPPLYPESILDNPIHARYDCA